MFKQSTSSERIRHYTQQPAALPDALLREITTVSPGDPVLLYGLADLDGALAQRHTWAVLTRKWLYLADGDSLSISVRIARDAIGEVQSVTGLSCSQLFLLGREGGEALAHLHYSHRQRHAMEGIKYLLEHPEGAVPESSAESLYQRGLLQPVEAAQASISEDSTSVLW
jgi:hypothetical protein